MTTYLHYQRYNPWCHVRDNKTSTTLQNKMKKMEVEYQFFPIGHHRFENIEISIQRYKNHFIARLCSLGLKFHIQLWYKMLQQEKIIRNAMRHPMVHFHKLAYMHINGEFDYSRTPFIPPRTKVVIKRRPGDRYYWKNI